jgi:hypothetical protein
MDVRLTAEQRQLRDAAAKLADDLGPAAVQDLVEVAIVAEEFGRRLVDTPFLGPVLSDDLARHIDADAGPAATVAVDDRAIDARGCRRALLLSGTTVLAANLDTHHWGADLTRAEAGIVGTPEALGEISAADAGRWEALALVATSADLVGNARGAQAVACDYSTAIRSGLIKR